MALKAIRANRVLLGRLLVLLVLLVLRGRLGLMV